LLVEEERRAAFEEGGTHFESAYHITLTFLPPSEGKARAGQLLYESTERRTVNWRDHLAAFLAETDRFLALLDGVMPEIGWLSDEETLTWLHACVSQRRHPVAVP